MDFIERLFGVSPDGGNGTLEAVYLLVIAVVVAMIAWRKLPLSRWRRKSDS